MQKSDVPNNQPSMPLERHSSTGPEELSTRPATPRSARRPRKIQYTGPVRFCANDDCDRPLHLGRHKSTGDICARCRKAVLAREIERRAREREFGTPEQIRQQLADNSAIPDDPLSEEWARRCRRQKLIDAFKSLPPRSAPGQRSRGHTPPPSRRSGGAATSRSA